MSMMMDNQPPFIQLPADGEPSPAGGGPTDDDYRDLRDHILELYNRERDEIDSGALAGMLQAVQKLLSTNQQTTDKALGDPGLSRLMRKAG